MISIIIHNNNNNNTNTAHKFIAKKPERVAQPGVKLSSS